MLVALDEVQDPQNLGAIARTAECAGATGLVICPSAARAEVTPAACKASAGAVEHLRIARVRNLADFLGEAKTAGLLVLRRRRPRARPYAQARLLRAVWCSSSGPRARACGRGSRQSCDELVALPLRGRIGSLNVSAAAAALLYGILQGRSQLLDIGGANYGNCRAERST